MLCTIIPKQCNQGPETPECGTPQEIAITNQTKSRKALNLSKEPINAKTKSALLFTLSPSSTTYKTTVNNHYHNIQRRRLVYASRRTISARTKIKYLTKSGLRVSYMSPSINFKTGVTNKPANQLAELQILMVPKGIRLIIYSYKSIKNIIIKILLILFTFKIHIILPILINIILKIIHIPIRYMPAIISIKHPIVITIIYDSLSLSHYIISLLYYYIIILLYIFIIFII